MQGILNINKHLEVVVNMLRSSNIIYLGNLNEEINIILTIKQDRPWHIASTAFMSKIYSIKKAHDYLMHSKEADKWKHLMANKLLRAISWLVVLALLFQGIWGILAQLSDTVKNHPLTPIICHLPS